MMLGTTNINFAFRSFSEGPKNKDRQQEMFVLSSDNNYHEIQACTKLLQFLTVLLNLYFDCIIAYIRYKLPLTLWPWKWTFK